MSKMRRNPPAFTAKPEPEFVREQPKPPEEPQPMECPKCKARLVERIPGGDAALDLARCQQCGQQYKVNAQGDLEPYAPEQPKQTGEPLAKVMTNDETPRCPFCSSVRLQPITVDNPWGRKWVCQDCCSAFREPRKGKVA